MGELVSADVASLSKSLMADFTLEGLFARVSPLMGLEVALLREALPTGGLLAYKWLIACVCPDVDVQVCFLREAFTAAWEVAVVLALLA